MPSPSASMGHRIEIELDEFGWSALSREALRQGISREELLKHAVMYYLADLDSGRIVRRAPRFDSGDPFSKTDD